MRSRIVEKAASRGGTIPEMIEQSSVEVVPKQTFKAPKDRMEQLKLIVAQRKAEVESGRAFAPANYELERRPRGVPLNRPIIRKAVEKMDKDLADLCFYLLPPVSPETKQRVDDIRSRAQAISKQAQKPPESIAATAEEVLTLLGSTAQAAHHTVERLRTIPANTNEDSETLQVLVDSNNQLIDDVLTNVQPLVRAIEENDPNLAENTLNAALNLSDVINRTGQRDFVIADNATASSATYQAAGIEDNRNANLFKLSDSAQDAASRVRNIVDMFEKTQHVPKSAKVRGFFDMDKVLDIDQQDLTFPGGIATEAEVLEAAKKHRQRAKIDFATIDKNALKLRKLAETAKKDENIDDWENDVVDLLNDSIEVVNDALIELTATENQPVSKEKRAAISKARMTVAELMKQFE